MIFNVLINPANIVSTNISGNSVFRFFIIFNCPATLCYLLSVCLIKLLLEFLLFNVFVYDIHYFFVCINFQKIYIHNTYYNKLKMQPFLSFNFYFTYYQFINL